MAISEMEFNRNMTGARAIGQTATTPQEQDFWIGYQRGLRRVWHGTGFGTDAEHELWLSLAKDKRDMQRRYRGLGYRAGFAGKDLDEAHKEFQLELGRSAAASSLGASKSPAKTEAARANAKRPRPGAQGKPKPRKDPADAENTPAPRLARTVKTSPDGRKEMVFQVIELLEDVPNPCWDKRKSGVDAMAFLPAGSRLCHEIWTDLADDGSTEITMINLYCRNGFAVQGEFRKAVLSAKYNVIPLEGISTSDALFLAGRGIGREAVLDALVAVGKVTHEDILAVSGAVLVAGDRFVVKGRDDGSC